MSSSALSAPQASDSHRAPEASVQRDIEALLFVADESLSVGRLAEILAVSADAVERALQDIARDYAERGFVLRAIAGGYRFATSPRAAPTVAGYRGRNGLHLSDAAIEALTIIAHGQPATRSEVDQLRGVDSAGVVATLLQHGLIEERGHRPVPGRPALLVTTARFLETFGLWDVHEFTDAALSAVPGPQPLSSSSCAESVGDVKASAA